MLGKYFLYVGAAVSGLHALACNGGEEGVGPVEPFAETDAAARQPPSRPREPDAHVTCRPNELIGDLGWSNVEAQHTIGEAYVASIDYVGDEQCVALRYDSMLLGVTQGSDQPSSPLTIAVSQGFDVAFGEDVPSEVRALAREELVEPALFQLEGVTAEWLDAPAGGWLGTANDPDIDTQYYRLREATFYPQSHFLFIVTRTYAAERVTNFEGGTHDLGTPEYPEHAFRGTSYECPALPLGDIGGALFYDGVFLDTNEGFSSIIARADVPRRFCSDLPGSSQPVGNGTLTPPVP